MFRYSTYFVLAVSISLATCITDYCGRSDLCTDYQHVTCGASGGNGQACPPGSGAIELTSTQVQEILDLHNNFRNQIAGGHVPGYRTAAKMTSMVSKVIQNLFFG